MAEPSLAMQKAVYATLSAALDAAVYDEAPLDSTVRYVQIGDDAWAEDDSHGDETGFVGVISIEVWDANTAGRSWIKARIGEIYDALHQQPLTVEGFDCNWVRYKTSSTQRADDRPLYRGLVTFEVRLQPDE